MFKSYFVRALAVALLLVGPLSFAASPTIVGTPVGVGNTTSGNTTSGGSASYTIATTGDDLIIMISAEAAASFSLSSITASAGSITTDLAVTPSDIGGVYIGTGIYRVHSATAQAYTVTIAWSAAVPKWSMILAEGSGIGSVDGTVPAQNAGSSVSVTTNATTSTAGDLIIAEAGNGSGGTESTTWTSPFSSFASTTYSGVGMYLSVADYTQTSTGSVSAAATLSASTTWAAGIVAYSGSTGTSCTHAGLTSGGAITVPTAGTTIVRLKNGSFGTVDCSTVVYFQPTLGNFGVN